MQLLLTVIVSLFIIPPSALAATEGTYQYESGFKSFFNLFITFAGGEASKSLASSESENTSQFSSNWNHSNRDRDNDDDDDHDSEKKDWEKWFKEKYPNIDESKEIWRKWYCDWDWGWNKD